MVLFIISYYLGRAPLGWWMLQFFGYRGHFSGIYTYNCFRQALLDFGWEGALLLLLSGFLKGTAVVWWAQVWRLPRSCVWIAVCLLVLGVSLTHRRKYQDGSPVLSVMGSFVLLAPPVWQFSLAVWFASLVLFRRTRFTALVTSMSFPWLLWYYEYTPWEVALGVLLSVVLVDGITDGRLRCLGYKLSSAQQKT